MENYIFIKKALFFPKQGILAVGDLHLGYDYQTQQSGVMIPERQIEEIKTELKEIFEEIKEKKLTLKKIVFIGDIKHSFSYEWMEKNYFNEILDFVRNYVADKNIILIKGNHDTIDYSFSDRLQDYYIEDNLAFTHGHKLFMETLDKKIDTILIGHLHPSVMLSDKQNIKREKYKCFLVGKSGKKNYIVLPSFLRTIEGTTVNDISEEYKDNFSIIPKKDLLKFDVYVAGEKETYHFGKISNLL